MNALRVAILIQTHWKYIIILLMISARHQNQISASKTRFSWSTIHLECISTTYLFPKWPPMSAITRFSIFRDISTSMAPIVLISASRTWFSWSAIHLECISTIYLFSKWPPFGHWSLGGKLVEGDTNVVAGDEECLVDLPQRLIYRHLL